MKFKKIVNVILVLLTTIFSFGQYGGPNQIGLEHSFEVDNSYSKRTTELDSLITWQERVILHLDKSIIAENISIFFKAYLLTGPNRVRATLSKVLKVELRNKEKQIVATQYHKVEDGMTEGVFTLPKKMEEGTYTLLAFTRWMQNYGEPFYFTKELQYVSNRTEKIKDKQSAFPQAVTFHPEGGNLVADLSNKLLIKIHSKEVIGATQAKIIDKKNNVVAEAVSFGPHLMSAIFYPRQNENYWLKMNNGRSYQLPASLTNGYLLSVNNIDPTILSIRVQATSEYANSRIWIKGEMSGITYFKKELELTESSETVDVKKHSIPFGLLTISVIDDEGKLQATRPVYIDANNDLKLNISPQDQGANEGKLTFKIKVTDAKGIPVATEVALSATNIGYKTDFQEIHDRFDFNWQSNDGDSYGSRRRGRFLTDLNLLTQESGDNKMISQQIPNEIKYPFQQGLDLLGYAYNLENKLLKNTKIQMLSTSDATVQEFVTDSSGRLRLENLQFVGKTELVFRTVGDDTSSRLVKIIPYQESFETGSRSSSELKLNSKKKGNMVNASPWQPVDKDRVVELEEVEVIQKKLKEKRTMPSVYGIEPTKVKFQDVERPKTIPQLFLGIPGVQVIGLGSLKPSVNLPRAAGMGPVLWVLDGMPLAKPIGTTRLASLMNTVNYVDVERVEVLFGSDASIYGSRASGGAIIVYTRSSAGLDYLNRKEGHLNFQGYSELLSFNSYDKKIKQRPKKYRKGVTTLFWDSKIKADENGEATFSFSTPIEYYRLVLKASTVTMEGEIGSVKVIFEN